MKIFSLLLILISTNVFAQQKPNIIFIVADDLGYGNLTSYNPSHKVPTPDIDQLAKEGTRFYAESTVTSDNDRTRKTAAIRSSSTIMGR